MESSDYSKILLALGYKHKISSLKKYKSTLAAYISESSKSFGINLTAPQIHSLFDNTAYIKNSDTLIDIDFDSPEAFAKSIQRKSPLYKNLFDLDIS